MKDLKFNNMHILWGVLPIIVALISVVTIDQLSQIGQIFAIQDIKALDTGAPDMRKAYEVSFRLFLISVMFVYFITATLIIGYTLFDLWRSFKVTRLWPFVASLLCVVLLGYIIHINIGNAQYQIIFGSSAENVKLTDFLVGHENTKKIPFYENSINIINDRAFHNFNKIYDLGNYIISLGLWAIVVGAISCLAQPNGKSTSKIDDDIAALKKLDSYLLLAAIMMVGSIVYVVAWMSWPSFVFDPKGDQLKAFKAVVKSMAILFGITYSIFIASYYIPIRLILLNRLPKEIKVERAAPLTKTRLAKDGGKSTFAWIPSMMSTTQAQKEFYSAALKIASPILAAWLSANLV